MKTEKTQISTQYIESSIPLGNFDAHEDENYLVNRLYYAVPKFKEGRFRCSFSMRRTSSEKKKMGI